MIRLFFCPCLCLSFFLVASCRANHDHDIASTYNTPAPPPGFNHNKASFKPGIAIIVGVLTTIFSVTFLILLYVKHCKREDYDYHNNPRGAIAANSARKNSGIDRNVIYMLPVFRFGSLRGQKDGLECAVCLNKFEPTEVLRLLPKCKHAFHVECVDTWLDAHSTCPLCRYRVDPEDILLIEDNKNPHQEDNSQQRVHEEEEMMEIRRVSGRHSSAGERGSSGSGYLQVIVENPPNRSKSSMEFRRSLDSSMRLKRDGGSVSMGCFERSRRDGLLLAGKEDSKKSFERRFEHRIVVSSGGSDSLGGSETQQRWSNVHPSDLLYLRSEMIISDSRRMSGSSSRPSVASPSGQRQQQNQKVGEGGGINEDEGQGKGKGKGKGENGRSVINERSVSEITGVSRVRSNEEQERRKEQRKRQEEGFVIRWLAWISDTTTNKSPPPPPPPPPAVSHTGGQPSNSSP